MLAVVLGWLRLVLKWTCLMYMLDDGCAWCLRVVLNADRADSASCRAYGPGLEAAVLGEPTEFNVDVYDKHKNLRKSGGDNVEVLIKSPKGSVPVKVVDSANGTYQAAYTAITDGRLQISVTIDRQAVLGSPFSVEVAGMQNSCCTVFWMLRSVSAQGRL
jgi:hypothetical protein